ncbi:MAG: hypothetical protein R3F08_04210 [Dokdonella sp.]
MIAEIRPSASIRTALGWPGIDAILAPEQSDRVVGHRMTDMQAVDGLEDNAPESR